MLKIGSKKVKINLSKLISEPRNIHDYILLTYLKYQRPVAKFVPEMPMNVRVGMSHDLK